MKKLVLSEGKRDVRLVEVFYEELDDDVSVDTFYGEDVDYQRLKPRESNEIRKFLGRRNPDDVLAKSENGKENLKRVFTKLVSFLAAQDVTVTLLIDLDGNGLDALLDDLDTRVADNYQGNEFAIQEVERLARSRQLIATQTELYSERDGRRGTFELVAFREDLETAADVRDSDDDDTEGEKLREFVADERATAPMRDVLL